MKEWNFYFNGNYATDLDVVVKEYISIPATTETYDKVDIIGRNGSIYNNKGIYQDKEFTVTLRIRKPLDNFWGKVDRIKKWLYDIQDNRFIYDREDRCLLIKKVIMGDIARQSRAYGEFKVTFIAEPFLYDIEETILTYNKEQLANMIQEGTYYNYVDIPICNLGDFYIFPTIYMEINGNVTFYTDSGSFAVTDTYTTSGNYCKVTIDSKNKECNYTNNGNYPMCSKSIRLELNSSTDLNKLVISFRNTYR